MIGSITKTHSPRTCLVTCNTRPLMGNNENTHANETDNLFERCTIITVKEERLSRKRDTVINASDIMLCMR